MPSKYTIAGNPDIGQGELSIAPGQPKQDRPSVEWLRRRIDAQRSELALYGARLEKLKALKGMVDEEMLAAETDYGRCQVGLAKLVDMAGGVA